MSFDFKIRNFNGTVFINTINLGSPAADFVLDVLFDTGCADIVGGEMGVFYVFVGFIVFVTYRALLISPG